MKFQCVVSEIIYITNILVINAMNIRMIYKLTEKYENIKEKPCLLNLRYLYFLKMNSS